MFLLVWHWFCGNYCVKLHHLKNIFSTLLLFSLFIAAQAQVDFMNSIDREQNRIDALDGKTDSFINIGTDEINARATAIYIAEIDTLKMSLLTHYPNLLDRNKEIIKLLPFLKEINHSNYAKLNHYEKSFKIINRLYDGSTDALALEVCKSYYTEGLKLIGLFNHRSFAESFLLFVGKSYPLETLGAAYDYSKAPYLSNVVRAITYDDPHTAKQFLGTGSPAAKAIYNSNDSVVKKILEIYRTYGQSSNSFINIDAIMHKRLTLAASEVMNDNADKNLNWLIAERMRPNILGSRSIERRIGYLCHEKVDKINELHEASNAVRFRSVVDADAKELYTLMVYTQEEIYTSSFLGLYERLKPRMGNQSGLQFLRSVQFNQFRTFIKECAGFNTLDDFFKTMSLMEQDTLLEMVVADLDKNTGDIMAAVVVADIYGSLTDSILANTFSHKIYMQYLNRRMVNNAYGQFIYGMLYKLCGGNIDKLTPVGRITFSVPDLTQLKTDDLFKGGQNIQQHLFFDDEDGRASYNSFIGSFKNDPNWRIIDQPNYICIRSKNGFPVLIFANKPEREAQGQEELAALFASLGRYPDIAVHRGHSYYLDGTIDILSQSTRIAILGSCGGYHQVAKALENAADVQIISTKQIGTMSVNDVLIKDLADLLRSGKTLEWKVFWQGLEKKLKSNEKFYDYIPPYKNLGAIYIKAYRLALERGEFEGIY